MSFGLTIRLTSANLRVLRCFAEDPPVPILACSRSSGVVGRTEMNL